METPKIDVEKVLGEMEERIVALERGGGSTPFHFHNGIDSPQLNQKNVIDSHVPYVYSHDFTSTETVTLSPGFAPKRISAYGYAVNTTLSPDVICITQGSADVLSATEGICNSMQLSQDGGLNVTYGLATFDDRILNVAGYSATVNVKVTAWTDRSVTLTATIAANWTVSVVLSIT